MRARWLVLLAALAALVAAVAGLWPSRDEAGRLGEAGSAARSGTVEEEPIVQPLPPDRGELSLTGKVLRPDGAPASGAVVQLTRVLAGQLLAAHCADGEHLLTRCDAPLSFQRGLERLSTPGALAAEARVVAGPDGSFRFDGLGGTSYVVWASSPPLAPAVRERAAPGEPVTLRLLAPRSISGTVTGDDGKAVVGARVLALSRVPEVQVAVTSAGGAFSLSGLGDGPFYVVAGAPGYVASGALAADPGVEPLRIELGRERSLDVVVRQRGAPAEALVRLSGDHLEREATAKGGLARFEGLPFVELTASASLGRAAAAPKRVLLTDRHTEVVLDLADGGSVAVTAVDDDGMPVPSPVATVSLGERRLLRRAGGTGERLVLGPLAPGAYTLLVTAEGFRPRQLPLEIRAEDAELEVALQRAARISGRVLDEYGRPAPGVIVTAEPVGEQAPSDAQGRFTITVATAGLYTLEAHHSDWGGATLKVTAPAEGVELSLSPKASAEIRVEADGHPVEGADVHLRGEGVAYSSDRSSGADGIVAMRGIDPGAYIAFGTHPDYFSETTQVTLEDGQIAQATVRLQLGAVIRGVVRDDHGSPVGGAYILARHSGADPIPTAADGRFEVRRLRPGMMYALEVRHPDFDEPEGLAGKAGGPEVEIVLQRRQRFSGRVVAQDGGPISMFEINKEQFVDPEGKFEIGVTPQNGVISLVVSSPGYLGEAFTLPAAKDVGALRLERAPELTGIVKDSGAPVPYAEVDCDLCERSVMTGADGRFRLPHAPVRTELLVMARKGNHGGTARATPGHEVQVTLEPWARVRISAFAPDGSPAAGVRVDAISMDGAQEPDLVTAADGTVVAELPPGNYRFALSPMSPILVAQISSRDRQLVLGPAPGMGSLTVHLRPQPGFALTLVPGALSSVDNPPISIDRMDLAQIQHYARSVVVFQGLAPGPYTLVFANQYTFTPGGPRVVHVDVNGPTELDLDAQRSP